ncbi:hypothetical protein CIT31_08850 [Mesorhizobium wenxiniae]|uniref:Uncharacterized protein n=2 Tax=Mesorhizobium wenxiniae TaxID=2014805 RepID=A0A271KLB4_9HYPH|nr:hypothetical protein CIT31_08850 [Mesorhizobium wenxiniae]
MLTLRTPADLEAVATIIAAPDPVEGGEQALARWSSGMSQAVSSRNSSPAISTMEPPIAEQAWCVAARQSVS